MNIIKENRLAKERLLSLLFYKDSDGNFPFRIINERLTVEKIKISLAPRRYLKENMLETLCIIRTQNLAKYFDSIYDVILQFWDSNFDISKAHASKYYKEACDYMNEEGWSIAFLIYVDNVSYDVVLYDECFL